MLSLIWTHFFADFVFQSNWMAQNKSKSFWPLVVHIFVYSLFFIPFGWKFAALNGSLHFITDFFSSKATAALWKRQEAHWFFVVIGLDQAIHLSCLYLTKGYLW